jgi:adenylate kinase family enzyme
MVEDIKKWLGTGSVNIFGYPFSGKDTQGRMLAELIGAKLIGGGEILRSNKTPNHIKEHLATGELTPTHDYLNIVLPYLQKEEYKNRPLILSAVGRCKGEEADVIEATNKAGHPLKAVIFLNLSEQEVWRRWKASEKKNRGDRSDDKDDTLKVRIKEYKLKTLSVIGSYKQIGLLIEVNAAPDAQTIFKEIIDKLDIKAKEQL